jgi:hypothetical protein
MYVDGPLTIREALANKVAKFRNDLVAGLDARSPSTQA